MLEGADKATTDKLAGILAAKHHLREEKNGFNSADIGAFKNVWVFCEQRQGEMMPTTFELISEGRKLADELGVELCGILLGDNVDGIAAELGQLRRGQGVCVQQPAAEGLHDRRLHEGDRGRRRLRS